MMFVRYRLISFIFFMSFCSRLFSQVWENRNEWNEEMERNFAYWIQHHSDQDLFTSPTSPYFGIKTDCADLALSLRIIFASQHQLPFFIGTQQRFNNLTTDLNHLLPSKRLLAFIDRINLNIGSADLAKSLSYPIAPQDISPGDLYIYTDQGAHHTYVVKELRENGNLLLLYSTVPRKTRKIELRVGMPAVAFTSSPYGFRRFRFPQYFYLADQSLPHWKAELSLQYDMLAQLGPEETMKEIRRIISKRQETFKEALERRVHNSCTAFRMRQEQIDDGAQHFAKNAYQCLNQQNFALYSTPLRDMVLFYELVGLKNLWIRLRKENVAPREKLLFYGLNYLSGLSTSPQSNQWGKQALQQLCPHLAPIDPREYIELYAEGAISSNPHHSPSARWGLTANLEIEQQWSKLNSCPSF